MTVELEEYKLTAIVKLPGQVSRYARDPQGWTEKYSRAFLYRDVLVAKVDLDTGNLTWPRD